MSTSPDAASIFGKAIAEHLEVVRQVEAQQALLESIAVAMTATLRAGGKILWCGNGGSAGDSQHLAAEIVGRFRRERRGLASIALTTDTSVLTSVANDYGFEAVFSRQIEALGIPGDLVVGISTSGNSRNVVAALEAARAQGLVTVAFTGEGGGKLAELADHLFAVASRDTARIQEAHILAGHMLCDWVELAWTTSHSSAHKGSSSASPAAVQSPAPTPSEVAR
jgi:D-sedoheptulose 7-phosphate isomerase